MASSPERDRLIRFGRFTFDATNARLCRGDEVIPLRGKTLAVLEYLTARRGQLVSKDELLEALWPEVSRRIISIVGAESGKMLRKRARGWLGFNITRLVAQSGITAPREKTPLSCWLSRAVEPTELTAVISIA